MSAKPVYSDSNIISIELAAHTVPEIKEISNSDYKYVLFGLEGREGKEKNKWRNQFPQYLVYLLNRSAKHNAIVTGKAQYVTGKGFEVDTTDEAVRQKIQLQLDTINGKENSLELLRKVSFDMELFNGFALHIIGNKAKNTWAEIYHTDFADWRSNIEGTEFYFTKDWSQYNPEKNQDWKVLPAYDPNKSQAESLLYFKSYRSQMKVYPFPDYIGALAYIECDYEIANFHLNNLKNGFVGATLVSLNNGTPKGQNEAAIEQKLKKKFTGTDNTGKLILLFSDSKEKEPTVLHLTPSDMDKQFDILNKTVQQEIFTGHKIPSPMLFGIKTEGQLGGRDEVKESWELFRNNYIDYKQSLIEGVFNDLFEAKGFPRVLNIQNVAPIGLGLSDDVIVKVMTPDEIREKAGLPKLNQPATNIDGTSITPTPQIITPSAPDQAVPVQQEAVNENIKNLTGRQHQQMMRIVRQFTSGKLTESAARTLLKTGLALNDSDIDSLLGVNQFEYADMGECISAMEAEGKDHEQALAICISKGFKDEYSIQRFADESIIKLFQEFGTPKSEFNAVLSKGVKFSREMFAEADTLTAAQDKLLQLVKKDPLISVEDLSKALKLTTGEVNKLIDALISDELIGRVQNAGGKLPGLSVTEAGGRAIGQNPKVLTIQAMYDYRKRPEAKGETILPTSRQFCKDLISLDKYYSRADIEKISSRLGYSVFDYAGGFWTHSGGDVTTPYCRHQWFLNLVTKKSAL